MIAVVGICAMGAAKDVAQANTKAIPTAEIAYITRFMTLSLSFLLRSKFIKVDQSRSKFI